MRIILFIGILFLSLDTFAMNSMLTNYESLKDENVEPQQLFNDVALKIKEFFEKEKSGLSSVFPEFKAEVLIDKLQNAQVEFVNDEVLVDSNGVIRICLNYAALSKIKCSSSEFEKLEKRPKVIYVLILHQYLRLIGVKETAPDMDNRVDGYKISRKIFPYIAHHGSSLWFVKKSSSQIFSIPDYENRLHVEVLDTKTSNNFFLEAFTSLYPSEKKLIKKALRHVKDYKCSDEGEGIYYKDAHAFYVYNYRLDCEDDRCPRTAGKVVVRYICGKERLITIDKTIDFLEKNIYKSENN